MSRVTAAAAKPRKVGRTLLVAAATCALAGLVRSPTAWVPQAGARARPSIKDVPSGADVAAQTSRRDVMLASLMPLFAGASPAAAELDLTQWDTDGARSTPDPRPPQPSEYKWVRELQKLSWKNEPYRRMSIYLESVTGRMQPNFWNPKYFVHWANNGDNIYKFDILSRISFEEARDKGRLLLDPDVSSKAQDMKVYIYKSDEDREWVQKNLPVDDLVDLPQDWKENIEYVKTHPMAEIDPSIPDPNDSGKPYNYWNPQIDFLSDTSKQFWKDIGLTKIIPSEFDKQPGTQEDKK